MLDRRLRKLRIALATLFASLNFGVTAFAQDYPEFDGVYMKMNDGSFVELHLNDGRGSGSVHFQSGMRFTSTIGKSFFEYSDFESYPVFDLRDAGPIVVIGSPPQDLWMLPIAEVRDYYREFVDDPRAIATHSFSGTETTVPAAVVPSAFVRQDCGYGLTMMQIKRISPFVTEYYLKPDLRPSDGSMWHSGSVVLKDGRCVSFGRKAVAFNIKIDARYYASFRSTAGVNDFQARTKTGLKPSEFSMGEYVSSEADGSRAGVNDFQERTIFGSKLSEFSMGESISSEADKLDGSYHALSSCPKENAEDYEGYLKVTENSYTFFGYSCTVSNRSLQNDTLHSLTLNCSGEGEEWSREIDVQKLVTGDLLIYDGGIETFDGRVETSPIQYFVCR